MDKTSCRAKPNHLTLHALRLIINFNLYTFLCFEKTNVNTGIRFKWVNVGHGLHCCFQFTLITHALNWIQKKTLFLCVTIPLEFTKHCGCHSMKNMEFINEMETEIECYVKFISIEQSKENILSPVIGLRAAQTNCFTMMMFIARLVSAYVEYILYQATILIRGKSDTFMKNDNIFQFMPLNENWILQSIQCKKKSENAWPLFLAFYFASI